MKKKMFFAALLAVTAASGIAGLVVQRSASNINALVLANIEALSNDNEDDSSYTMPCCIKPEYTGSWSKMALDCNTCSFKPKYSGENSSRCRN